MVAQAPDASEVATADEPADRVVLRDPRAIKALAHPARLAVIDEFFAGRKLTATECAQIAGLSASAMSYHLRALEKWGIIRRSEATGDGRERPWEAAGDSFQIDSAEPRVTAAGEAILIGRLLDRQWAEALAWMTHQDELTTAWYDSMVVGSGVYWLTHDEAKQLSESIGELLTRYEGRRANREQPPGTRRIRASFTVVPIRDDSSAAD
ncbi:MAG: winged helix-turn-helix domain-containing protein [Jatrophihabitantaceae bacterium]